MATELLIWGEPERAHSSGRFRVSVRLVRVRITRMRQPYNLVNSVAAALGHLPS